MDQYGIMLDAIASVVADKDNTDSSVSMFVRKRLGDSWDTHRQLPLSDYTTVHKVIIAQLKRDPNVGLRKQLSHSILAAARVYPNKKIRLEGWLKEIDIWIDEKSSRRQARKGVGSNGPEVEKIIPAFLTEPPPTPSPAIFSFTVSERVVLRGGSVSVEWHVLYARDVLLETRTVSGEILIAHPVASSGRWTVPDIQMPIRLILQVTGLDGSKISDFLDVSVSSPPTIVSFGVSPTALAHGSTLVAAWRVENAQHVRLECQNGAGQTQSTVQVSSDGLHRFEGIRESGSIRLVAIGEDGTQVQETRSFRVISLSAPALVAATVIVLICIVIWLAVQGTTTQTARPDQIYWQALDKSKAGDAAGALDLFVDACGKGVSAACTEAGLIKSDGRAGYVDNDWASQFFWRGCNAGQPWSCTHLGFLYENGLLNNGSPNFDQAHLYYQKGCNGGNGDVDSCRMDSSLSSSGATPPSTPEPSAPSIDASQLYQRGQGEMESKQFDSAYEDYSAACTGDYAKACATLGDIFYNDDEGKKRDLEKALSYYEQACTLRDGQSCASAATMYHYGQGGSPDKDKEQLYSAEACRLGIQSKCP
jgi:hypothetical protein